MSDCASKSTSSLVVADKSTQKPAGCVGIFFKLFDWNRKFAKKKLFPKKLLGPSHVNQVSKKFSRDENLAKKKHLLSGDANGGARLEGKRGEMRPPGLVAKLMGLESIPAVKPPRGDKSSFCGNGSAEDVGFAEGLDKEILVLAKSGTRNVTQPRRSQKTGLFERRPVNSFGADALQIRNVLSRSRKRHSKLASPVKSPRVAKSASRLIDAATRILEPGLQARSRAKCALTYSNSTNLSVDDEAMRPDKTVIRLPVPSTFNVGVIRMPVPSSLNVAKPQDLKAQTSCQNCGHSLEGMDHSHRASDADEQNPTSNSHKNKAFFDMAEESKQRQAPHCDRESEVVLLRSRYQPEAVTDQDKAIFGAHQHETILQGMPFLPIDQQHWGVHDRSFTTRQGDASPSVASNHRAQVHSHPQMLIREDRVPPRSTFENMHNRRVSSTTAYNDKKDFIAMSRNVSEYQFRSPRNPDNFTEVWRQHHNYGLSTQRNTLTERNPGVSRHGECSTSYGSMVDRERCIMESKLMASRPRFSGNLAYPPCVKSQPFLQGSTVDNGNNEIDDMPFSFKYPLKSKSGNFSSAQMDDMRMDKSCFSNEGSSQQRLVKQSNHRDESSSTLLENEDALGQLLVQKLKELTSQGENESRPGTPQGRTAAAILQELISALTAVERPISPDINDTLSSNCATTTFRPSQVNARGTRLPMKFSGDHFSPGSVLDASFSNDSCVSSSIDDCLGNMHHADFMDMSLDDPHLLNSDADLYHSSSSMCYMETGINVPVIHLLDHISRVLDRTNLPDMKLCTPYSGYTKEVLFNTELLFGNTDPSERFVDFLLGPFLFELETLAIAAWRNTITSGFQVSKGGSANPLRRFLFDCLIECLNTRYGRCIDSGFTSWSRLPKQLNMEVLIRVFDHEVVNWASLSGMSLDEITDWEMSTSLSKWTDADDEAFETGAEIGLIIFQDLVDEIVADFMLF